MLDFINLHLLGEPETLGCVQLYLLTEMFAS
jgi:hypothetical protein